MAKATKKAAKKAAKKEVGNKDEQLALIDVEPENMKEIAECARVYKRFQKARMANLKSEVEQKERMKDLIKKAKLQPLEDGVIRFKCEGLTIQATPKDVLITVKGKLADDSEDGFDSEDQ